VPTTNQTGLANYEPLQCQLNIYVSDRWYL